jgi:hypothetical protein
MECESFHFQAAAARIVSSERHMIGELRIAAKVLVLANARPGQENISHHSRVDQH